VFYDGFYVIDGIRVLPTSDAACSSDAVRHRRNRRNLQQSYTHMNEEDKVELVAELDQMEKNEGIFKPDKIRKLPHSNGHDGHGFVGYRYDYKGSNGISFKGRILVRQVQSDCFS
jgi:hypothetical protein